MESHTIKLAQMHLSIMISLKNERGRIKKRKAIVAVVAGGSAVIIFIILKGLYLWFEPYFHAVSGYDYDLSFGYHMVDDKIILSHYGGEEAIVYVPERLKGRDVVVGEYCFSGKSIEEVYVPSTVEVEGFAFSGCENLRKFQGGSNTTVYSGTFYGNKNLEEVLFTNTIEKIEGGAFRECARLKNVDFIKNVKYLGSQAFSHTDVEHLPELDDLEYAGNSVFWATPWEESQESDFIIVGNTLQLYKGYDQVVYVPEGITTIWSAFMYIEENCPVQVKEVYIPDSVEKIGRTFVYQEDITVYIPESVVEIDKDIGKGGKIKIVTTKGSYAEEFAKEYGIEYEIVDGWE